MAIIRKKIKKRSYDKPTWGCPKTKNRSNWCYGLCYPTHGKGDCGRPAGHAQLSRTQKAIKRYLERQKKAEEKSEP